MIIVNQKKLDVIAKIAHEIVSQQTLEELELLRDYSGQMYDTGKLAAEVAVKLCLRIFNIEIESRAISAVDFLVDQAETAYRDTYAG